MKLNKHKNKKIPPKKKLYIYIYIACYFLGMS